ncbi:AAA family ATPase [bacterium]|nr:AAA family ATPase [bacterium]
MDNRTRLKQIRIAGFKSINSNGQIIPLKDINIMLGANGSGKSNLISFFKMISYMSTKALQDFIGKQGFSDAVLHYGAKRTDKIEFDLEFEQGQKKTIYSVKLSHGLPDRLFFAGEKVCYSRQKDSDPQEYYLESGSKESGLHDDENRTGQILLKLLRSILLYQFHDTSDTAKIRNHGYIDDTRYLRSGGGNLAAFLRAMREDPDRKPFYDRIVRHIQRIMPQFRDFDIEPSSSNSNYIRLNWREKGSDYLFGPHQISDGSLRFMALASLLLQPVDMLPTLIILDEPELGLHPAAMSELAGMIRNVATKCQVLVATQSTRLVDEFDVDDLIIVEMKKDKELSFSEYKRLEESQFSEWLERYSASELWEKNVYGGQP